MVVKIPKIEAVWIVALGPLSALPTLGAATTTAFDARAREEEEIMCCTGKY